HHHDRHPLRPRRLRARADDRHRDRGHRHPQQPRTHPRRTVTGADPAGAERPDLQIARVRRRSRRAIIAGQVPAGIGMGSTLAAGALLITEVSGSETLSGMAATMATIGAALAAVPLAALATGRGRAPALATGAALAALGAVMGLVAGILAWTGLLLV